VVHQTVRSRSNRCGRDASAAEGETKAAQCKNSDPCAEPLFFGLTKDYNPVHE